MPEGSVVALLGPNGAGKTPTVDILSTLLPADGTYFQCVRYDGISDLDESAFAQWLTREIKVAAIPVSAFYSRPTESGIVRFCFAKKDETLALALERLARI